MKKEPKVVCKEIFKNKIEEERQQNFTKMWVNLTKNNYDVVNNTVTNNVDNNIIKEDEKTI